MINKGDAVRVIPSSYFSLCKRYFNYPDSWMPADSQNNEKVMLGGKYKVLDIHTEKSGTYFKLIEKNNDYQGEIHENFVKLDSNIIVCPFSVGDKVVFDLSPDRAREYINILHQFDYDDKNKVHEVKYILNDYYVFIDYGLDDLNAFPFEWKDLKAKK